MNDGVYLDTTFLLSCLRMAAYALKNHFGEQRDSSRVNDPQPFHPFLSPMMSAVRRKLVPVRLVQVAVNVLEELLRVSGIGIGQGATLRNLVYAYVMELAHFCRHCRLYLAQGVEAHDDCIQHRK